MTAEIRGVHFEIQEKTREYIEKKLERLEFAKELLLELPITITRGKKDGYEVEANLHFRWGSSAHLGVQNYDVLAGIDSLFDKLEAKVAKEKSKIQEHKGEASFRTGEVTPEDAE